MRSISSIVVLSLALAACGSKRIPGTDIEDNRDTRAVVAAIEEYRRGAERRDARAVLALVSAKYFDEAGTPDPGDDVDFQRLSSRLTADYQKIASLRLDIGVRKIEIDGDKAEAIVFYDQYYRIVTKTGEVPKQASDSQRMRLVREGETWRFVSGL